MGEVIAALFTGLVELLFGKKIQKNPGKTLLILGLVVVLAIAGAFVWMFI